MRKREGLPLRSSWIIDYFLLFSIASPLYSAIINTLLSGPEWMKAILYSVDRFDWSFWLKLLIKAFDSSFWLKLLIEAFDWKYFDWNASFWLHKNYLFILNGILIENKTFNMKIWQFLIEHNLFFDWRTPLLIKHVFLFHWWLTLLIEYE